MKKYLICLGGILILFIIGILLYANQNEFLDIFYADIDLDNQLERLTITHTKNNKYGNQFAIWEYNVVKDKWYLIYENNFTKIKPWKIEVADIDGDNIQDIAIGVYKRTIYDNEEKNRLFIFNYIDGKLVKKWTGSILENDLEDFYFKDVIPAKGYELISMESGDKGKVINIYYWFGFGFRKVENSEKLVN